ncbi:hypothetical protein [Ohtaekwangia sp.]|uniref:hypothetical protein n=1 Tax=Ohtaekwangia sp. TaxID=2066019 RepID=UPI002FDD07E1
MAQTTLPANRGIFSGALVTGIYLPTQYRRLHRLKLIAIEMSKIYSDIAYAITRKPDLSGIVNIENYTSKKPDRWRIVRWME